MRKYLLIVSFVFVCASLALLIFDGPSKDRSREPAGNETESNAQDSAMKANIQIVSSGYATTVRINDAELSPVEDATLISRIGEHIKLGTNTIHIATRPLKENYPLSPQIAVRLTQPDSQSVEVFTWNPDAGVGGEFDFTFEVTP